MRPQASGALLGLAFAAGILLLAAWALARRRPGIAARIRPFITGGPGPAEPLTVGRLVASLVRPAAGPRRAATAGPSDALERLVFAAVGAGVGGVMGLVLVSPGATLALSLSGGVAGALLHGRQRQRRQRQRRDLMERQLPVAVELLAFSVTAGESAFAALSRTAGTLSGPLADEIAHTVAEVRSGSSLESALRGLGERSGSAPIAAFVDSLILGIERGTPLAEALRAQAADLQAAHRRHLVEQAGRKDVAMLVPVVFLVLPTVVAVALFPGLQGLRLVVP